MKSPFDLIQATEPEINRKMVTVLNHIIEEQGDEYSIVSTPAGDALAYTKNRAVRGKVLLPAFTKSADAIRLFEHAMPDAIQKRYTVKLVHVMLYVGTYPRENILLDAMTEGEIIWAIRTAPPEVCAVAACLAVHEIANETVTSHD